ncbi:hypothetical protein MBLNU457_3459t1 [Dothideomycetes sp. NU457]
MADLTPIPSLTMDSSSPESSNSPVTPIHNEQTPTKLKGRKRLIAGFQRISSSPSLAKLSRSNSIGYNNRKASASCVSLSSPGAPFDSSIDFNAYSTAPTSAVSTPGVQVPAWDERARTKYLESLENKNSLRVPGRIRSNSRLTATPGIVEEEDYFSIREKPRPTRTSFNLWADLPSEIRTEVLSYLEPKEVVRCSIVSKAWRQHCFDGQLWSKMDTSEFYQNIPAEALANIITQAGPFVRDLNLRGCVQLREMWQTKGLTDACKNLENFSLEGCRIDRTAIHCFLLQNSRLMHLNLTGLAGVTNAAMKIVAQSCPNLEHLNISWCHNVDTRGLRKVVESCRNLRDLRASETTGWSDLDFADLLFETNRLERLVLTNCESLSCDAFKVLIQGRGAEIDVLTGRAIVPSRRLKHLDITNCRGVCDKGLKNLAGNANNMEGLQLSKLQGITDNSLTDLIPTMPNLTHLDLEELDNLTNLSLQCLANSPCASGLRHLSISYCENLGDTGMLPIFKNCTSLRSVDMDNTRISDLVLAEAAAMVRKRSTRTTDAQDRPKYTLRLAVYDCQNVTWTGVREILSRNAEVTVSRKRVSLASRPATPQPLATAEPEVSTTDVSSSLSSSTASLPETKVVQLTRSYPTQIIELKCFYNYQPTVREHTKRVLRGDFASANRLERKWAEFMVASEEAGAGGAGARRRRRRAREAQMMHADEADPEGQTTGVGGGVGGGRRRRARSGGCVMM